MLQYRYECAVALLRSFFFYAASQRKKKALHGSEWRRFFLLFSLLPFPLLFVLYDNLSSPSFCLYMRV
jgi:hypothetical protein